jgi:hypothetical protein
MVEIAGWFTMNGKHIPYMVGQSKAEAAKNYLSNKHVKQSNKVANSKAYNKFKDSKGNEIEVRQANPKEFKDALDKAKASQPEDKAWRVDNYSHTLKDYAKDQLFITKNGATIAITPNGDIISVCNNTKGNKESMRAVMEFAVSKGGKKLDSYDGNFSFYTKMGFKPVSWCKFDEQYAPDGWRKGIDKNEPIVFFTYKGSVIPTTADVFYKNTKASKDYDTAMNIRDKGVK